MYGSRSVFQFRFGNQNNMMHARDIFQPMAWSLENATGNLQWSRLVASSSDDSTIPCSRSVASSSDDSTKWQQHRCDPSMQSQNDLILRLWFCKGRW